MTHVLVLAETDGARILPGTGGAITLAQQMAAATGGDFTLLIVGGAGIQAQAEHWRGFGAVQVLVTALPELAHPTADRVAAVCVQAMQQIQADVLVGVSSSFGRDILPRVAALLDLPMLSDVVEVQGTEEERRRKGEKEITEEDSSLIPHPSSLPQLTFLRPMYAGNIVATVQIEGEKAVLSARGTAFGQPNKAETVSPLQTLDVDAASLPKGVTWIGLEGGEHARPELTSAPVVVSGGLPLRDAATFEQLVGGLADKLGGAVGATRAAVDGGLAPNELQVGQTGKVVAPSLYIAVGISGSVQHLAGMKDSKTIVAINTNPDAPIFEVADYGLVADLHTALPELISKL